jgi:PHP family Zn ribbon phosphoesterase
LAFFEFENQLAQFQQYLDEKITIIPNPDGHLGYQPVVDENDNILELIPNYLPAALKASINEIQHEVGKLNGIFIPAHIDRPSNSIFSQLGFIPKGLKFDALGISSLKPEKYVRKHYNLGDETALIRNSDAHFLNQIGEIYTVFYIEEITFHEIELALAKKGHRYIQLYE